MSITTGRTPDDVRRGASYLLGVLGTRIQGDWTTLLRRHGLTQNEYLLLIAAPTEDGARQRELASAAGIDPRNTGAVVAGLVEKGLLAASRDPGDARAKLLIRTAAGGRLLSALEADLAPDRERYFGALSETEYVTLCDLLQRVAEAGEVGHDELKV
ncbi:MarR family winged helix-turn-helix transcriptional regulator [Actinomyces haliotis]|uniref:MarR family winged helix-turn-helix transcriptional regulator n=1 Tax=Actinomyces haliotis TaxID=1280843 RepID=UPI00188FE3E4|nr:MarR family winged helix-turn-helix transcriptional regulator [Actinomyces haliotis]